MKLLTFIRSYSAFKFSGNEVKLNNFSLDASRLPWVDHARGIAILFVVYRHVIIGMKRSGLDVSDFMYNIQESVYNFRMPVFFVLSGIFVARSLKRKSIGTILRFRISNLLYPYIYWGALTIVLQILFSSYANTQRVWTDIFKIILQPRSVDHLWYLLALFNVSLIYLIFEKFKIPLGIHFLVSLCLYFISKTHYFEGNSLMSDAFYFYIYFQIGAIISELFLSEQYNGRILNQRNILFILPFFLAGQFYWFNYKFQDLQYAVPFLIINLIACYFVFLLSAIISQWKRADWLGILGKKSLYIYVMHVFISSLIRNLLLFYYPAINPWICLLICFPLCLFLPVVIYNYLMQKGLYWFFTLEKPRNNVNTV